MSPWELVAFYIVAPLIAAMTWIHNRFETDGPDVPEFEQWCERERPVLLAVRCVSGSATRLAEEITRALGPRREVENHQGVFPWTRYVFKLHVEVDEERDVVRARVAKAAVRRVIQHHPEFGGVIANFARQFGDRLQAIWLHAELRREDEERDPLRRERGWQASVTHGRFDTFLPTFGLPSWARPSEALVER